MIRSEAAMQASSRKSFINACECPSARSKAARRSLRDDCYNICLDGVLCTSRIGPSDTNIELYLSLNVIALQVLDFELQRQLVPYMKDMVPLPGIYDQDFIAANQVSLPLATQLLPSTTRLVKYISNTTRV